MRLLPLSVMSANRTATQQRLMYAVCSHWYRPNPPVRASTASTVISGMTSVALVL